MLMVQFVKFAERRRLPWRLMGFDFLFCHRRCHCRKLKEGISQI